MDEIVKRFRDKYWNTIKEKRNVVGYSGKLRPRIRCGREVPGTKVIRIYVEKKEDVTELSTKDLVPRTLSLGCVNQVETDIVEIGKVKYVSLLPEKKTSPSDHQKRYRPYPAGVSATNEKSTACTLNVPYVKKSSLTASKGILDIPTVKMYISSNNHCFGLENKATVGDNILNPSPYDGGVPLHDTIGKFAFGVETKYNDFTCPVRNFLHKVYKLFCGLFKLRTLQPVNTVDIAFAEPVNVNDVSFEVLGLEGRIVGRGEHSVNSEVYKSGRTTGVTKGVILDDEWAGQVQGSRGTASYEDCILCSLECAGGDSGSPVLSKTQTGSLLYHGALFAGSDMGYSIVCKVENIERESGLELAVY